MYSFQLNVESTSVSGRRLRRLRGLKRWVRRLWWEADSFQMLEWTPVHCLWQVSVIHLYCIVMVYGSWCELVCLRHPKLWNCSVVKQKTTLGNVADALQNW